MRERRNSWLSSRVEGRQSRCVLRPYFVLSKERPCWAGPGHGSSIVVATTRDLVHTTARNTVLDPGGLAQSGDVHWLANRTRRDRGQSSQRQTPKRRGPPDKAHTPATPQKHRSGGNDRRSGRFGMTGLRCNALVVY